MDIGKRIRQLRVRNGLTQEELASRCELTKGFVSQLENNLTTPSLPALMDLVEALGSDMSSFFSEEREQKVVFGKEDFFEDNRDNCRILWVVPNAQKNTMEPMLLTLLPHQATRPMMPHEGEEFGYVLSGSVVLENDNRKYRVKKGETFYIRGDHEHLLRNTGAGPARILWISTPPSF
ncbi:MAG: cupin domain-containing protein [Clostridia bacterium]|nr:cupin domain-containing protein [Clostridia bacterium]